MLASAPTPAIFSWLSTDPVWTNFLAAALRLAPTVCAAASEEASSFKAACAVPPQVSTASLAAADAVLARDSAMPPGSSAVAAPVAAWAIPLALTLSFFAALPMEATSAVGSAP